MSYPPPQHPYYYQGGPPPPQGYPPPQQGYYPPQGPPTGPPPGWGSIPPAPPSQHQGYSAPPHSPSFGAPPYGYPPQGYPPQNYLPQQQPGYGAPPYGGSPPPPLPPPLGYPGYQSPQNNSPYGPPPLQPPYGFGPPQPMPTVDITADVSAIYHACRGLGTDEAVLIRILAKRDGPTIDAIRRAYHHGGGLIKTLSSETSGDFRTVLIATALGPLESCVFFAHRAVNGAGTDETMLTEAIMSRTNAEIMAMKQAYQSTYGRSLEAAVRADLSMKTEELFVLALRGHRAEDWVQPNPMEVGQQVQALYAATKGRIGTDETTVSGIITRANDQQLRAIIFEYGRLHGDMLKMIRSEFSGHMRDAFIYILEGAKDRARRDAQLMEAAMKGFGTKDGLLIMRVVRCHWDRRHMEAVKSTYRQLYGKELGKRIRGDTSGHYRDMLLEMVGL